MVSPEQAIALAKVRDWQREVEGKAGLSPGYTDEFSLVQFRQEGAMIEPVQPEKPEKLPNANHSIKPRAPFFKRIAAIF
ncbi:hypothetical protein HYU95_05675 [Candidatus Daviesbacteria bacterium]|nr:hypothetical protein [Candidatus Daviesbacteria bacterium]